MIKVLGKQALCAVAATALSASAAYAGTSDVIDNGGRVIGSVAANGGAKGVVIRVSLNVGALAPGWHGMHLHATGDCSDHAAFKNAKSHVNHGSGQHGLLNPSGPEDGDLPNLHVAADGSAQAEFWSPAALLGGGGTSLLDSDGTALVIHAAEDDHRTLPIGNSGARLACSVLK
jgi:Cu-Zn family superoxide dismutase